MIASSSAQTHRYGPAPGQEGDLYLPAVPQPPVICLLHGGFWRMPHGRDQMTAIAGDLAARGFAVWNLEYRRLGQPQAGWPGTMDDVAAGIDHLARIASAGADLDLERITVVGHSAGGQLSLWVAARSHQRNLGERPVRVRAAVGLAPIADLARAYEMKVGGEVVAVGPPRPSRCSRWACGNSSCTALPTRRFRSNSRAAMRAPPPRPATT
jgi:acetyl esterase/lipase